MRKRRKLYLLVLPALLAGLGHAAAQTPAGVEFQVNPDSALSQFDPRVAMSLDGSFAFSWIDTIEDPFFFLIPFPVARFYDPQGRPYGGVVPLREQQPSSTSWVVSAPHGGYRLYWVGRDDFSPDGTAYLQNYSRQGVPFGPRFMHPPVHPAGAFIANVASLPSGKLVYSWSAFQQSRINVAYFTPRGDLLRDVLSVAATPEEADDPLYAGDIEVDRAGNAVVTWGGECGTFFDDAQCDVFAQRLTPRGEKLGEPIRGNTERAGSQGLAGVAVAPDGSFLLVWATPARAAQGQRVIDVRGQRFSPMGSRLGREIRLAAKSRLFQSWPEAIADAHGNYLTVWIDFEREEGRFGWNIRGQLFRADGRRVGREFRVNTRNTFNEAPRPKLAFSENGTFVVVWNADDGDFDGIFAQRFAASPGAEPCMARDGRLLCDTGRTGGEAELELALPGGEIVFGDVDGDGRADPCVFEAGLYRCDLDHRGEPWEATFAFGRAGDVPLLGDVDGDGRDEPCVWRDGFFLCDTARDGARAEVAVRLGTAADQPLLGDLNGDGRDDPCVFEPAGRWRCAVGPRRRPNLVLDFGAPGGPAALGDFDGDGRDDPCTVRDGEWACDTAHDGGTAEARLAFGRAGDRPLLGNLDGL